MKMKMYSFFDSAAQAFTNPFFMHNDGLAIRAFQDHVNSKDENNIALHPDQFTLFKIAEWDDKNATITLEETPKSIAIGVELINDDKPRYSNTDLGQIEKMLREVLDYKHAQDAGGKEDE